MYHSGKKKKKYCPEISRKRDPAKLYMKITTAQARAPARRGSRSRQLSHHIIYYSKGCRWKRMWDRWIVVRRLFGRIPEITEKK